MTATVVLTGASGNLGRAVASAFADTGANLALLDVKPGSIQESATQIFVKTDLLDPQSVQAAADRILQRFGRIDVLCNLAGGFRMGAAVHETSAQDLGFPRRPECAHGAAHRASGGAGNAQERRRQDRQRRRLTPRRRARRRWAPTSPPRAR